MIERIRETVTWHRLLRQSAAYGVGLGGSALCTLLLLFSPSEQRLDTVALLYLGVVVSAAFLGGIGPGVATAVVAFGFMNHNFIPPIGLVTVTNLGDLAPALAFLGVAGLVSHLLARSRREAAEAGRREHEAQAISEMVQVVGRTDQLLPMLVTVTEWTTHAIGADSCTFYLRGTDDTLDPVTSAGALVTPIEGSLQAARGATATGQPVWIEGPRQRYGFLPVSVGEQVVGVLSVTLRPASSSAIWAQERVWMALAGQLGLAMERLSLRDEATEAEVLRRSDDMKSVLLATVSHELGTPLAVIKAAASALTTEGSPGGDDVRRDLTASIEVEVDRLRRIVTDLLDVTRIEGGALNLSLGWYEFAEFLQEAISRLRPRLGDRKAVIRVPDALLVEFDYSLLDRVIDNLVSNALRYTPDGRPVVIEARPLDDAMEVVVVDEGPGVPDSELTRVFDKFHHVDGRPGGLGLGLAICQGIIEAHNGKIWARNRDGSGRGLEVHFTLPWRAYAAGDPLDDDAA